MSEQRKNRRFDLRLPIEMIRPSSRQNRMGGETRNISSSGVLVCSETVLELGETIEYYITLPSPAKNERLRLHCVGKVVRAADIPEAEVECPQSVAMTMERYEFTRQRIATATPLPRA